MAKSTKAKTIIDRDRYWNGVFTGVFIGCFFISVAILAVLRVQGLKVAINPNSLARLVQLKVQTELRSDLPKLVEGIKHELPAKISNHLTGIENLTINIGKSQVKLPEEVQNAIKDEFNQIIEEAVFNTVNDYSSLQYEQQIGENTYQVVKKILIQDLIGKTYVIKPTQWFSVPIRIVGSSNDRWRIGI